MTHAEQEQQLLDYFAQYRATTNLAKFATAATVNRSALVYFLDGERALSADALAKVQQYLKKQAQALQAFTNY